MWPRIDRCAHGRRTRDPLHSTGRRPRPGRWACLKVQVTGVDTPPWTCIPSRGGFPREAPDDTHARIVLQRARDERFELGAALRARSDDVLGYCQAKSVAKTSDVSLESASRHPLWTWSPWPSPPLPTGSDRRSRR